MSPLSPELRVSVNMALVDSGSSDCELREGFLETWQIPHCNDGQDCNSSTLFEW